MEITFHVHIVISIGVDWIPPKRGSLSLFLKLNDGGLVLVFAPWTYTDE